MSHIEEVYDFSNNLEHFLNPAGCNFCPAGYGAIRCSAWASSCEKNIIFLIYSNVSSKF